MKKLILSIGFLLAMVNFSGVEATNINVNINIGTQPAWGPVGYNYVAFYYFPDINVYYNVNQGLFYYPNRGRWISSRYLPYGYRHYDLYGLYKVVIADNDPWRFNSRHMRDYRHFKGNRSQIVIRNSHDNRYRDSRRNEVRWYDDNRGNNRTQGRDSNNGRSTAGRNDNSHRQSDNKRTERPNGRSANSSAGGTRSGERVSVEKSRDNSSSRTESGRSSTSNRR